jgi:hypothetical protein
MGILAIDDQNEEELPEILNMIFQIHLLDFQQ